MAKVPGFAKALPLAHRRMDKRGVLTKKTRRE